VVEQPTTHNEWEYGGLTRIETTVNERTIRNTSPIPMIDLQVPSDRRGQEITCKKCMKGAREENKRKRKNLRRVQGESGKKELVAILV
jgi:hypothetical protein